MMINAHAAAATAATVARLCDRQTDAVARRVKGGGGGGNVYQYSWHSLLILTEAKLMSLLCM